MPASSAADVERSADRALGSDRRRWAAPGRGPRPAAPAAGVRASAGKRSASSAGVSTTSVPRLSTASSCASASTRSVRSRPCSHDSSKPADAGEREALVLQVPDQPEASEVGLVVPAGATHQPRWRQQTSLAIEAHRGGGHAGRRRRRHRAASPRHGSDRSRTSTLPDVRVADVRPFASIFAMEACPRSVDAHRPRRDRRRGARPAGRPRRPTPVVAGRHHRASCSRASPIEGRLSQPHSPCPGRCSSLRVGA